MATEKRERQRANRQLRLEQEAKLEKKDQRRQIGFTAAIVAVVVLAGLGLLYLATRGGDGEDTAADGTEETATAEDGTNDTAVDDTGDGEAVELPQSAVEVPAPGGTIEGPTECPAADGSSERITSFTEAPPECIDPSASYQAVISTNLGDITVELDAEAAPVTVNNFVVLSRYHYYQGAPFHRIIPGFVIQGGDAVGPVLGQGNPGYLIEEEPPPDPAEGETAYQIGSLAMAKALAPTSTGSQFFIVTGDAGAQLPPDYSLFGTVTNGMDIVSAIEAIPTTPDDYPTEPIYIESVAITES